MRQLCITIALAITLPVILANCAHSEPDEALNALTELTQAGACADAFFWAANESDDLAVTFSVEAKERSTESPTAVGFSEPVGEVVIEVVRGSNLGTTFCTDLPQGRVDSTTKAASGRGEISLDPAEVIPDCGTVAGRLHATEVTAQDGTAFAPIAITSDQIGCYAG